MTQIKHKDWPRIVMLRQIRQEAICRTVDFKEFPDVVKNSEETISLCDSAIKEAMGVA